MITENPPTPPATPSDKPRKFRPSNPELRAELKAYFDVHPDLTREKAGVKLGVHASYVSKFISGNNDFDVEPMERRVADFLKSERLRSKEAVQLFPTFISRRIAGDLATIRKTGDFGLIFSAAGLGKTSGIKLEQTDSPLSLALTASRGTSDEKAVQAKIFSLIETKSWDGRSPKWDFIVKHLKDSGRLLMIDNAQRLSQSALQYLFDLHDETSLPIAILGNPEVEKVIRGNDQMFSRIGLKDAITLPTYALSKAAERKDVESVVDGILQRMVPAWAGVLRSLALQVAWQRGHFRAVRKTITLAHEMSLTGGALADPRTAFQAAHLKLVRDFSLEGDE